jgi:hypothetical protein
MESVFLLKNTYRIKSKWKKGNIAKKRKIKKKTAKPLEYKQQ